MRRGMAYAWAGVTALVAPAAHACPDCYSGANGDPIVALLLAAGGFLVVRSVTRTLLRRWRGAPTAPTDSDSASQTDPPK